MAHKGYASSAQGFFCLHIDPKGDKKMLEKSKTRSYYVLPDDSTIELTNKLFTHTKKSAFSLWDLLESQLSKIDPKNEPEIYKTLSSVAYDMSKICMSIKASTRDYDYIEILMFLEREV
jgi:succinylglutamate desuccinylase